MESLCLSLVHSAALCMPTNEGDGDTVNIILVSFVFHSRRKMNTLEKYSPMGRYSRRENCYEFALYFSCLLAHTVL